MLKIFKWVLMSKEDFTCACSENYKKGWHDYKKYDRSPIQHNIIYMLENVDTWDKNLIKNIQRLVGEL